MTKEKNKHDHKLTNLLKVGIFALLMIAPLFASVSQWIYATINKNAYQSYYGETINEKIIEPATSLESGKKYILDIKTSTLLGYSKYDIEDMTDLYIETIGSTGTIIENILNNCTNFIIDNNSTLNSYIGFRDENDNTLRNINLANQEVSFTFTYISNIGNDNLISYLDIETYNQYSYLDNAFYYGVDKMTQSDLFNWTENTTIYTGIKGMTDNLEIQTNAIAILLTYWTILTIIYVIFDILIQGFTFITHKIVE